MVEDKSPILLSEGDKSVHELDQLRGQNIGNGVILDIVRREEKAIDCIFYVEPGQDSRPFELAAQRTAIDLFGHDPVKKNISLFFYDPREKSLIGFEVGGRQMVCTSFGFTIGYPECLYHPKLGRLKEKIESRMTFHIGAIKR